MDKGSLTSWTTQPFDQSPAAKRSTASPTDKGDKGGSPPAMGDKGDKGDKGFVSCV